MTEILSEINPYTFNSKSGFSIELETWLKWEMTMTWIITITIWTV